MVSLNRIAPEPELILLRKDTVFPKEVNKVFHNSYFTNEYSLLISDCSKPMPSTQTCKGKKLCRRSHWTSSDEDRKDWAVRHEA